MNWKEHPHLFANEHFCIRYENEDYTLIGIEWGNLKIWNSKQDVEKGVFRANCQLIARQIEDMTDGEVEDIYNLKCETNVELSHDSCNQMREFWEERVKSKNLKFITANGFISIGVYPFSDTKDVIFKPKQ